MWLKVMGAGLNALKPGEAGEGKASLCEYTKAGLANQA